MHVLWAWHIGVLLEGGRLLNSKYKITGRLFRGGVILSIYGMLCAQ